MKKILYITLILNLFLFATDDTALINIGNIYFNDMNWLDTDTSYEDVLYSKQAVISHTANEKAVILYFFDLRIC